MDGKASRSCLAGKAVIVTGAAGGIGRCVAKAFALEGTKLLLADIQDEKAHDVAVELNREGGGQYITCAVDIGSSASLAAIVKTAITQLGAVDPALRHKHPGRSDADLRWQCCRRALHGASGLRLFQDRRAQPRPQDRGSARILKGKGEFQFEQGRMM